MAELPDFFWQSVTIETMLEIYQSTMSVLENTWWQQRNKGKIELLLFPAEIYVHGYSRYSKTRTSFINLHFLMGLDAATAVKSEVVQR